MDYRKKRALTLLYAGGSAAGCERIGSKRMSFGGYIIGREVWGYDAVETG
ncbi:MAG: hypothetical protein JXD19_08790 [Deltaproteobacteria bacterium]|nr:hypothetical protein [Deltaproteobacteria bacterium]